ncbi:MAG: UPF0262 family protein [Hyphomicrobiales bacterium]|nr:UPF0262 family protein [Hyphomicrobiales bacterium]
MDATAQPGSRLIEVTLDEASIGRAAPEVEQERAVAVLDILDANMFELEGGPPGPYRLALSIAEQRLALQVSDEAGAPLVTHILSLSPFRRIVKDYFMVCESYFQAIKTEPPSRIEAIDMGRRGLHDEGAKLLTERLQGKIKTDFNTARRLFTLLCALHWKG